MNEKRYRETPSKWWQGPYGCQDCLQYMLFTKRGNHAVVEGYIIRDGNVWRFDRLGFYDNTPLPTTSTLDETMEAGEKAFRDFLLGEVKDRVETLNLLGYPYEVIEKQDRR